MNNTAVQGINSMFACSQSQLHSILEQNCQKDETFNTQEQSCIMYYIQEALRR